MHPHFTISYDKCRNNFLRTVNPDIAQKKFISLPSVKDSSLGIDYVYIPAQKERTRLVILCSGIHGIETYIGSALQQIFWKKIADCIPNDNTGFIFLHGINAFGFKYYRRVTENNVDLNRNFDTSSDLFSLQNPFYNKLNYFINPKRQFGKLFFENINLYIHLFFSICFYGVSVLKQALPQGQYEFPKGIFFGGQSFEPHLSLIEKNIEPLINSYKYSLVLDLHTGAGEPGKMHLVEAPSMAGSLDRELIKSLFFGQKLENENTDIHKETGSFLDWIVKIAENKSRIIPVLVEFGTVGSSSVLNGIESLSLVLRENQIYHYGCKHGCERNSILTNYKNMFYPDDVSWQTSIVNQFLKSFEPIMDKFKDICR